MDDDRAAGDVVRRAGTEGQAGHVHVDVGDALRDRYPALGAHVLIEADVVEGVRALPLQAYRGAHTRICRPVGLHAGEIEQVIEHAARRLGQRYDMRNVIDLMRYLLPLRAELTQQHGFVHGGVIGAMIDTACGFAASSLMSADVGVLTVEYKINFVSAARGDRLLAIAEVRKAGRTVTFVEGEARVLDGGHERLVATMQATMMTVRDRPDVRH